MTTEEQATIHEYAGTWKAGERCASFEIHGLCSCNVVNDSDYIHGKAKSWKHTIPMPPLEGDYADVVAMKCIEKLRTSSTLSADGFYALWDNMADEVLLAPLGKAYMGICRAVLAYLEQEGK